MATLLRKIALLFLIALLLPVLFLAQTAAFTSGQWAADLNLNQARSGACTVTLADGRMLTTGGIGTTGALTSAEFLGAAGAAAPMSVARSDHFCVTLSDGRVLVGGGRTNGSAVINAAEVYDPSSGQWTPLPSALEARANATATLLNDGRVLIAGGVGSSVPLQTMQVFDPASSQFSNAPPMSSPRVNHAAALLSDGRVVIAGGSNGSATLASIDVYDPAANSVSSAPSMSTPRAGLSATVLLDKRVLLAGGGALATEILNLATGTIAAGPSMNVARSGHLALLLPDNNTVLMAGGSPRSASAEVFVPWTNQFWPFGELSGARTALTGGASKQLALARAAGGTDANGVSSAVDAVRFPTVVSDKADYSPGTTAVITGTGFQPGETVALTLQEEPYLDTHGPFTSVADANGNFINAEFVPDDDDVGIRFYLAATGQSSGLTAGTTFTDARNWTLTFAGTGNGSVKITASTGTVNAPVSCGGTGANATSQNVTSTCSPNITTSDNGATVTFLATAAAGSSFAGWSAPANLSSSTCSGTTNPCSAVAGSNAGLTVTFNTLPNNPSAIASNTASITVNEGQAASNTGTWSDADAGDTVTLTASVGTVTKAGTNAAGIWSWSFNTTDGPVQSQTVTITANDGHTTTNTTFSLTVNNVSPTGALGNNGPVNEGSPVTVSFTAPNDPSSIDAGSLHYAYSCTNGDLSGATYAGSGASSSTSCTYNDNGSFTAKARIIDKDGGFTEYTTSITVNNVAPTSTLSNDGPINEGGTANVTFSGTADPSSADTTAGFHYAYSCDGSPIAIATYAAAGTSATTACPFDDNGSKLVKGRIFDKDNGFTDYDTTVVVNNVAPSATFSGPVSGNEGDSKAYSFTAAVDPSSVDTTAGFRYAYSCDGSAIGITTYAAAAATASANCTFSDNGSIIVRGRIFDKDDGFRDYSVVVTVTNVAPTATLSNNGPVNEGSPVNISFSGQFDPSSADTAAGFHYAYSCTNGDLSGATYTGSGASASNPCTYDDNGSYTAKARIIDKDGGFTEYTSSITVNNVAPTATFGNNGPVNEGNSFMLSLTSPHDPSSADTAAGFQYAFDCGTGSGYAPYGASSSTSCSTDDSGTRNVKGKIKDKDGGEAEYSGSVAVNNVAPTATLSNNGPVNEGSAAAISFGAQSDPSSLDTAAGFHYSYSCLGSLAGTYAAAGTNPSANCTFNDNGSYTVTARIFDKDNGYTDYTTAVTVNNVAPTLTGSADQNANEGSSVSFSLGSFTDPGINDNPWHVSVDWGDGVQSFNVGGQGAINQNHTYDDGPNTYTVKVTVSDKDGGLSNLLSFKVTVSNVAPTATFGNNGPVNEGNSFMLSLISPHDPSSADTAAGFQYAFDCGTGSGYAPYGASSSTSCSTDDSGTRNVKGKIKDKDGGEAEYSGSVAVNNVAPTATLSNNGPVNEGSAAAISFGAQSDPSSLDTAAGFHYSYSCLGSLAGTYAAAGTNPSANCTFNDNGSYTVTARIFDKDNGYTDYTTTVTVNNVAPTLVKPNDQSVNEGSTTMVALGSFSDPGVNDSPWHVSVDWGDGTQNFNVSSQGAISQTHKYDDGPHIYTVKVTVTDKDSGTSNEISFNVNVANVAPTASLVNNGPVNEGSSATISFSGQSDPSSGDTSSGFHYAFSCINGSLAGATYAASGTGSSISCPFDDNGVRTVRARIIDKDNGYTEYTTDVTVNNVAPMAIFGPSVTTISEGNAFQISLTGATDASPVDQAAGFRFKFDCGSGYAALSIVNTATCTAIDNPNQTVKGQVWDKDNGFTEYILIVTVTNVAPSIQSVAAVANPVPVGSSSTVTASFADPGINDTHTCSFIWDGAPGNPASTVTEANGNGSCSATQIFPTTGVFTVSVTVTDKDGGAAVGTVMIAVYDPSGGFVTGGGWIPSPAGAYPANPALTGKANFGFESKYQKGANVPTGQTEFQYQVGNLNFHSTVYEWLVVSGAKAQYKGSGTINNSGNYGFLLTAVEGALNGGHSQDSMRMKIWDITSGFVVYDSGLGAGTDIDLSPTTPLGGGNVIIHK